MRKIPSVVIAIILLAMGCRENSITDPVLKGGIGEAINLQSENQEADNLILLKAPTGEFPLNCILQHPDPRLNARYCISGTINYRLYYYTPVNGTILNRPIVYVYLTYNAKCQMIDTPQNFDIVKICKIRQVFNSALESSSVSFEDVTKIRDSNLNLVCSYSLTMKDLSLNCMLLNKESE